MNMLNSVNLEFENILLLVLKPKPQTKPNRNIANQKPVWNRFGILWFFGHPNIYVLTQIPTGRKWIDTRYIPMQP